MSYKAYLILNRLVIILAYIMMPLVLIELAYSIGKKRLSLMINQAQKNKPKDNK